MKGSKDVLRVGLVGFGYWGRMLLEIYIIIARLILSIFVI